MTEPQIDVSADAPAAPTKARKPRSRKPTETAPAVEASPVVLRFTGDGSTFMSGIPNRDITQDDLDHGLLDAAAVKLAVKIGNHTKVGD